VKLLVVDDDPRLRSLVRLALERAGYAVLIASDGQGALTQAMREAPDLIVLDVGLPDMNGFELFKRLQQLDTSLPVIFLTARSSEIDRVVGLELGADDYIGKPFSPRELVARVRTVLRRSQRAAPVPVASAPAAFSVDDEKKTIRFRGRTLDLSRTEYRLLKVLIERPGRVYSRDELMQRAWDDPASAFDRTVDAHIKALRAKLRDVDENADPISTHRGMGYSLREDLP